MITPIDIGSESISPNWWMSFGFFRFHAYGEHPASTLVDPVTGAPPKNGKPLLLSYLVGGVKESTLLKAILGERGKKGGASGVSVSFQRVNAPRRGRTVGETESNAQQPHNAVAVFKSGIG